MLMKRYQMIIMIMIWIDCVQFSNKRVRFNIDICDSIKQIFRCFLFVADTLAGHTKHPLSNSYSILLSSSASLQILVLQPGTGSNPCRHLQSVSHNTLAVKRILVCVYKTPSCNLIRKLSVTLELFLVVAKFCL